MENALLTEQVKIVPLAVPVNTTGAAVASPWIRMSNHKRCDFVVLQGAWAGGTPALTINQAKDATGTGSKAVPFDNVLTTTLASDAATVVTVTSNSYPLTAVANTQTIVSIGTRDLDFNAGFCFVQLAIASPGSNADLIAAIAILSQAREYRRAELQPTVLA